MACSTWARVRHALREADVVDKRTYKNKEIENKQSKQDETSSDGEMFWEIRGE